MAEKRHRATKEEVLKAKLAKNAETRKKLQEKVNELDVADAELKQQLKDLTDGKKKADRTAEAKAKRAAQKKKEKEMMQAIKNSGLSMEEVMAKLGD